MNNNSKMDSGDSKLKKLEKILSTLDEGAPTAQEFEEVVAVILGVIHQLKINLESQISTQVGEFSENIGHASNNLKELEVRLQKIIAEVKQESIENTKELEKRLKDELNRLESLFPDSVGLLEIEARINGLDNIESRIVADLPKYGTQFRDGLELLKDDERLDISAIKGIEKANGKLADAIVNRALGIVDQRTSFLINKLSNLQTQVNNINTSGGSGDAVLLDGSNTSATVTGQVLYFNGSEWIALANPVGAGSYNLQNNAAGALAWSVMSLPITPSWSTVLTAGRITSGSGTQNPQLTGSDKIEFRGTGTYIYSSGANVLDVVSGGTLNINTTNFGIFGVSAVARQTLGATFTNNITSGGTTHTVANFDVNQNQASAGADTVDITDVPSKTSVEDALQIIRDNQYQQSADLKTVIDALRAYGFLT